MAEVPSRSNSLAPDINESKAANEGEFTLSSNTEETSSPVTGLSGMPSGRSSGSTVAEIRDLILALAACACAGGHVGPSEDKKHKPCGPEAPCPGYPWHSRERAKQPRDHHACKEGSHWKDYTPEPPKIEPLPLKDEDRLHPDFAREPRYCPHVLVDNWSEERVRYQRNLPALSHRTTNNETYTAPALSTAGTPLARNILRQRGWGTGPELLIHHHGESYIEPVLPTYDTSYNKRGPCLPPSQKPLSTWERDPMKRELAFKPRKQVWTSPCPRPGTEERSYPGEKMCPSQLPAAGVKTGPRVPPLLPGPTLVSQSKGPCYHGPSSKPDSNMFRPKPMTFFPPPPPLVPCRVRYPAPPERVIVPLSSPSSPTYPKTPMPTGQRPALDLTPMCPQNTCF